MNIRIGLSCLFLAAVAMGGEAASHASGPFNPGSASPEVASPAPDPTPPLYYSTFSTSPVVSQRTFYISKTGNDANSGLAATSSFATFRKAGLVALAGDTVIVLPGRYFEIPSIAPVGEPNAPVTFRAAQLGTVILSAADKNVLEKRVVWQAEAGGLYSIPYQGIPERIIYDSDQYSNIDLYSNNEDKANKADLADPNATVCLSDLRAGVRQLGIFNAIGRGSPAPELGFAFDQKSQRLYVKLSSKYGSSIDPNHVLNTIKISPVSTSSSNLTVALDGKIPRDAYLILDGLVFEAGGRNGVYLSRSSVIVRNCTFVGCYSGVVSNLQDNVIVEYCEFTTFPAYDGAREAFDRMIHDDRFIQQRNDFNNRNWWHRKTPYYEGGFLRNCGKNWKVFTIISMMFSRR